MRLTKLPTKLIRHISYEIVAERPDDDLPCPDCDIVGPVLIVKAKSEYRDVCPRCWGKLWFKAWARLVEENGCGVMPPPAVL